MTASGSWRAYLPLVTAALGWLHDPDALRAFLTSLAGNSEALATTFARVNARDILARALQGQAGPELKAMGQELLRGLAAPLASAGFAAASAARKPGIPGF